MEKFDLTLKNAKLKSYHLIGWLLVLLNIAAQFFFTSQSPNRFDIYYLGFGAGVSLLFFIMSWVNKFRDKKKYVVLSLGLSFFVWLHWEVYIAAIANALLFVLFFFSMRKFDIQVQPGEITFFSFPVRRIEWNELQNLILKDGILTIDFKNNKLLQNEIEENASLNEKDFNEFCRQQLNK
jgi:hypothetical protein